MRVECLGRVDESLLADLAVEGAREVVLIHGDCERCDHGRGRACAEAVVETAEKLLEIWGSPMTVRFSGKLPASAKKMADHDSGRRAVQHDTPHTIWHKAQTMMKTDQVYER